MRTSISKYVNSANFVVGRGSVTRSYEKVVSIKPDSPLSFTTGGYLPLTATDGTADGSFSVLTATEKQTAAESTLTVLTGDGETTVAAGDTRVATGDSLVYASIGGAPGVVLEQVTETLTAEDPENFIFAGKGWGHGVGISQYGTKDLADAGVPAEQILALYFPKATLCDYRTMQPADSTTQTDDAGNMPTADGESEE